MMEVLVQGAGKLGLALTPVQLGLFETYYRELVEWNRKFNLTSITTPEGVQARHFLDSLTVAPILQELFPSALPAGEAKAPLRTVDIGAGAGFPGIPLKIVLPSIDLCLIESTAKKATFLDHVVDELGLSGVRVLVGRAEDLAHRSDLRESFDLSLSRAVAALPTLVELTLPFVAIGGYFIAHKGKEIGEELKASADAIRILGGRLKEVKEISLDRILSPRNLVIIEKVTSTPSPYPRKAGLPSKRPL